MWLERVSGGDQPIMDLAEAKVHLRILDEVAFDDEINDAVKAATAYLDVDDAGQGGLSFPLGRQRWDMFQSNFPACHIDLPFDRVSSVVSVKYWDQSGVEQTLTADKYALVGNGSARFLTPSSGNSWPAVADRPDAVKVTFEAGHATMDTIPSDVRRAAKFLLGHYYENHSAVVVGTVSVQVQLGVDRLVSRYRRYTGQARSQ